MERRDDAGSDDDVKDSDGGRFRGGRKKRKVRIINAMADNSQEPVPLSQDDTILLDDSNMATQPKRSKRNGSEAGTTDDNETRQAPSLAREQATHVCEIYTHASFPDIYKRLLCCRDIGEEMQNIVYDLDKEDTQVHQAKKGYKEDQSGDVFNKKRKRSESDEPNGSSGAGASNEPSLTPSIKPSDSLNGDILWIQVQSLRDRFPNMDPNAWYARLENATDVMAETDEIIQELEGYQTGEFVGGDGHPAAQGDQSTKSPDADFIGTLMEDPDCVINQPPDEVLALIKQIRSMFPDAKFEMLFHRLIACDDLSIEGPLIVNELSRPDFDAVIDDSMDDDRPGPSNRNAPKPPDGLQFLTKEQNGWMEQILQMFPDSDPYFVVKEIAEKDTSLERLIDKMTSGSYPKLKDRLAKERQANRRQEYMDATQFQMEEFLKVFPDPEAYFSDTTRTVGELYRHHAFTQLQNDFPNIDITYLRQRLEDSNNHYLPAWRGVREDVANSPILGYRRKSKGVAKPKVTYLKHPRTEPVPFPDEVDDTFYRELQYVKFEDRIKDFIQNKVELRQRRIVQARNHDQLAECPCCFSDEVLPEEFIECSNDGSVHKYCQDCVQRHAEELIGQGRHQVTCLSDDCGTTIPLETLRRILKPRLIDLILRRSQQEEIRRAIEDNMETCPFCDFAVIIDAAADDDRVFRCQNPECLKQSCRLCKEPNHVPLKCNEVEKADETAMRTFVENRMAEAFIRTCPKCNKRIIKDEGCNKMMCPCGVYMCYICRQELDKKNPYAHFKDQGGPKSKTRNGCSLYTQMHEVHEQVAKEAGEKARDEYLAKHPELANAGKKTVDVKNLVDEPGKNADPHGAAGLWVRVESDDEDDSEEDDFVDEDDNDDEEDVDDVSSLDSEEFSSSSSSSTTVVIDEIILSSDEED